MKKRNRRNVILMTAIAGLALLAWPDRAEAHCDSLDGPVIIDAKKALKAGSVTPVLKWVKRTDEKHIRAVFNKTQRVRKLGKAARELADRFFFETLVRIHRAGEGAPYTGLKPAGTTDKAVALADRALARGSVATLSGKLAKAVAAQITRRYKKARKARLRAGRTVKNGRKYVAAYVSYVHFVESLHKLLKGQHAH